MVYTYLLHPLQPLNLFFKAFFLVSAITACASIGGRRRELPSASASDLRLCILTNMVHTYLLHPLQPLNLLFKGFILVSANNCVCKKWGETS